ncbi:GDP-mannose-dependent alpha-(1-6)-phosphatidylinositol monomannoside mannosyltransferase [Frankia canadensis]|uniref:GDP-mannose-dependent alpha-(1-6)-phosphatidylinositol monomannoside mannosyltransferase n=1 Tax=Frankia canadensis TaxID=1836972 RepID=A0A2I2KNU5_9ACTN|nr:GDP-mannose-dependent alpha-(1-6)-phosphatidylinositol monomannoside mannosyltransferase [Frankia canadensis]SOU54631.1 GDP-mannose-dependent alpha-(1-6)-phosphatidylinositol monomannoside mannosyltransferase [Frankia canadensis]
MVADKFPPVLGGIQTFACHLTAGLPADRVIVVAPTAEGAEEFDRTLPFEVVRAGERVLTSPRSRHLLRSLVRTEGCEAAWFPTAAPYGLLAPLLREAGVRRVIASSHGHEVAWSRLPVGWSLVRTVAGRADVLTYLTSFTRRRLAAVAPAGTTLARLTGGVDVHRFRPGAGGEDVRRSLGWSDRPVVICVARMVPRKGQDALIRGWPTVLRRHPGARLLLVGKGPDEERLRRLARRAGVVDDVHFAGAVPDEELPAHLDAANIFAMPSRTRWLGLDLEGLGLSSLEGAASGLPVITGAQGGAPDVVLPDRTGTVVDGRDGDAVTRAVVELLDDPDRAARMGLAGREWMRTTWSWGGLSGRLARLLADDPADGQEDGLQTAERPRTPSLTRQGS